LLGTAHSIGQISIELKDFKEVSKPDRSFCGPEEVEARVDSIPEELEIFENEEEFEDQMVKNLGLDDFVHEVINPRAETVFSTSPEGFFIE